MNPHSSKSRRNQMNNAAAAAAVNAAAAAAVSMPAPIDGTKTTPFLMDKQNNLIPRMNPSIKHELYFPQCYAPPFGNQTFGAQQQAHGSSVGTTNNSSVRVNRLWHIFTIGIGFSKRHRFTLSFFLLHHRYLIQILQQRHPQRYNRQLLHSDIQHFHHIIYRDSKTNRIRKINAPIVG